MPTLQTNAVTQAASKIRGLLAQNNITQAQVAAHLGLSQAAISRRLRGETPFDVAELSSIAALIGVPASSLLEVS